MNFDIKHKKAIFGALSAAAMLVFGSTAAAAVTNAPAPALHKNSSAKALTPTQQATIRFQRTLTAEKIEQMGHIVTVMCGTHNNAIACAKGIRFFNAGYNAVYTANNAQYAPESEEIGALISASYAANNNEQCDEHGNVIECNTPIDRTITQTALANITPQQATTNDNIRPAVQSAAVAVAPQPHYELKKIVTEPLDLSQWPALTITDPSPAPTVAQPVVSGFDRIHLDLTNPHTGNIWTSGQFNVPPITIAPLKDYQPAPRSLEEITAELQKPLPTFNVNLDQHTKHLDDGHIHLEDYPMVSDTAEISFDMPPLNLEAAPAAKPAHHPMMHTITSGLSHGWNFVSSLPGKAIHGIAHVASGIGHMLPHHHVVVKATLLPVSPIEHDVVMASPIVIPELTTEWPHLTIIHPHHHAHAKAAVAAPKDQAKPAEKPAQPVPAPKAAAPTPAQVPPAAAPVTGAPTPAPVKPKGTPVDATHHNKNWWVLPVGILGGLATIGLVLAGGAQVRSQNDKKKMISSMSESEKQAYSRATLQEALQSAHLEDMAKLNRKNNSKPNMVNGLGDKVNGLLADKFAYAHLTGEGTLGKTLNTLSNVRQRLSEIKWQAAPEAIWAATKSFAINIKNNPLAAAKIATSIVVGFATRKALLAMFAASAAHVTLPAIVALAIGGSTLGAVLGTGWEIASAKRKGEKANLGVAAWQGAKIGFCAGSVVGLGYMLPVLGSALFCGAGSGAITSGLVSLGFDRNWESFKKSVATGAKFGVLGGIFGTIIDGSLWHQFSGDVVHHATQTVSQAGHPFKEVAKQVSTPPAGAGTIAEHAAKTTTNIVDAKSLMMNDTQFGGLYHQMPTEYQQYTGSKFADTAALWLKTHGHETLGIKMENAAKIIADKMGDHSAAAARLAKNVAWDAAHRTAKTAAAMGGLKGFSFG